MEELKEAAVRGDVEFLRKCIASDDPINYLYLFPQRNAEDSHFGNIFHLTARESRSEFIAEAIKSLPLDVVLQLLHKARDEDMYNPLHVAATAGNLEIVRQFLDVLRKGSKAIPLRLPWLERNRKGNNPCQEALRSFQEHCGMEILKMDMENHCNAQNKSGAGLLYEAVYGGFHDFALEILTSAKSFSFSGPKGLTPLHYVTRCSGTLHLPFISSISSYNLQSSIC